jgi:hypothetical protein
MIDIAKLEKAINRAQVAAYRAKNPERAKASSREAVAKFRAKNPEREKAQTREASRRWYAKQSSQSRPCIKCGESFKRDGKKRVCPKCRVPPILRKECTVCGAAFETRIPHKRRCSKPCQIVAGKLRYIRLASVVRKQYEARARSAAAMKLLRFLQLVKQ